MRTLPLTRPQYEAVLSKYKTGYFDLVKVSGLMLNHRVTAIRENSRGFFAYTDAGLPIRVQPLYKPGSIVALCEPVFTDPELGNVYGWDYDQGKCPIKEMPALQHMSAAAGRVFVGIEKVQPCRLSELTDQIALEQGVKFEADGTFSFEARGKDWKDQPTAAGALVEWAHRRYQLPVHNYWIWIYTFKIISNLNTKYNDTYCTSLG